jgi:inner membrane protein
MASAFSHPAPVLAVATLFPRRSLSRSTVLAGVCCSILPDADVIGFFFGVPYGDVWGHRGFTHGLPFAALLAGAIALAWPRRGGRWNGLALWLFFFLATASHGFLDAFTNGGLGVGFFAPFSSARYFFPARPIEVSPIGIDAFFSSRGRAVLASEARWIWLPALAFASAALVVRVVRRVTPSRRRLR